MVNLARVGQETKPKSFRIEIKGTKPSRLADATLKREEEKREREYAIIKAMNKRLESNSKNLKMKGKVR